MVMPAAESMINTIPVVVTGGIALKFTEEATKGIKFPKPPRAKRKAHKKARRKSKR